ncbi:quinolinate synthase NadA [Halobacillus litoralis]|uniref:quinolinate synthase NadA n=1 Tax=Halobacillus litoralis TaxID=45668 RepID=UPI001CD37895|nr:quinolinate synthase NadA [Halobacillus litoralis]MCA0972512.1 quinolinate synthase NadA [Halobacillus litoralis]
MNLFETMQTQHPTLPERYQNMTEEELRSIVERVKNKMGSRLFMPGHHYQKDEVIDYADVRGDSLKLAQLSANQHEAEAIVFCGVHFMAETADILTREDQHVYLPDMRAGCSMADMADIHQTEKAWTRLMDAFGDTILPLTYVNSTAAIKAFVGRYGGATVTSSNAARMIEWAFEQKERILFLPDQHLGRNTAYDLGISLEEMAVWDPIREELIHEAPYEDIKVILWKGHCSVHENFRVANVEQVRRDYPDTNIIVHPECSREVVALSDYAGSTNYIIDQIENAPPGSSWAIGTEMNLVNRIIKEHPEQHIISLNPRMCPCLTMNRIDLPHLAWSLESIADGQPQNVIKVDESTAIDARKALERMLERA